jgi:hypothetical protein
MKEPGCDAFAEIRADRQARDFLDHPVAEVQAARLSVGNVIYERVLQNPGTGYHGRRRSVSGVRHHGLGLLDQHASLKPAAPNLCLGWRRSGFKSELPEVDELLRKAV